MKKLLKTSNFSFLSPGFQLSSIVLSLKESFQKQIGYIFKVFCCKVIACGKVLKQNKPSQQPASVLLSISLNLLQHSVSLFLFPDQFLIFQILLPKIINYNLIESYKYNFFLQNAVKKKGNAMEHNLQDSLIPNYSKTDTLSMCM